MNAPAITFSLYAYHDLPLKLFAIAGVLAVAGLAGALYVGRPAAKHQPAPEPPEPEPAPCGTHPGRFPDGRWLTWRESEVLDDIAANYYLTSAPDRDYGRQP